MAGSVVYTIGVFVLLGAFASYTSAAGNNTTTTARPMAKQYNQTVLPSVYVTVTLDMTWADFCMLEAVFRTKLAELIFDNNGIAVRPGQLRIHNYNEFCPGSSTTKYAKAALLLYVTKHDGAHQEDIDESLTAQTFKILSYLVESKSQWELGRVFNREVTKVSMGGKNAKPVPEKITEFAHTWIGIAIASAIVFLIVLILVIIHFVQKPKDNMKNEVRYEPRDGEQGAVITRAPEEPRHGYQEKLPANSDYDSSTKL